MLPRKITASRLPGLILLLWATGCSLLAPHFERPIVSVASIELAGGSLLQQTFRVKLTVQNPNDRALPVTGVHVELNVQGDRVASGVSDKSFVVPAQGSAEFDMDITTNLGLALLRLGQSQHPDAIDYEMNGSASLDLPFLHAVGFHQKGSLALKDLGLR